MSASYKVTMVVVSLLLFFPLTTLAADQEHADEEHAVAGDVANKIHLSTGL